MKSISRVRIGEGVESNKSEINYLDYYNMVRMFTRLIEDAIARDHVIYNIALGDFFGAEGLRS